MSAPTGPEREGRAGDALPLHIADLLYAASAEGPLLRDESYDLAVQILAAIDQMGARTARSEPQSDAEGSGVAQDVREALGAQKGVQGADDRPPAVWRHPCGWEQVSPIPARCPSCGGGEAWGGRRG